MFVFFDVALSNFPVLKLFYANLHFCCCYTTDSPVQLSSVQQLHTKETENAGRLSKRIYLLNSDEKTIVVNAQTFVTQINIVTSSGFLQLHLWLDFCWIIN